MFPLCSRLSNSAAPRFSGLRTTFPQIGHPSSDAPTRRECPCFQGLAIRANRHRSRTRLRDEGIEMAGPDAQGNNARRGTPARPSASRASEAGARSWRNGANAGIRPPERTKTHSGFGQRFQPRRAHSGSMSPWARQRSSTSDQIWSRSSSAAVCGSIIAAW